MKRVQIGEVMRLERTRFDPDSLKYYRPLGVRSFGNGLIEYDETLGADLSKVTYFKLPKRALILSNIKAWEGAVAVSSPEHQGFVSSQRLLPYVPISEDEVDVRFIYHYFLSESGLAALGKASPGSADRNRTLGRVNFESIRTPLPGIDEQRAIATRLDGVVATADTTLKLVDSAPVFRAQLPNWIQQEFEAAGLPLVPAGSLYSVVNDLVRPGEDPSPASRFVGLEYIESHTGRRLGSGPVENLTGRKFRFRAGEVLYGYLRPYQNKVWVADGDGLCSVEQFVLRANKNVDPHFLGWALRARSTLSAAISGTNNLQLPRLRSSQLASIPIFDIRKATPELRGRLEVVEESLIRAHALNEKRRETMKALPQAARNAEFARLMS